MVSLERLNELLVNTQVQVMGFLYRLNELPVKYTGSSDGFSVQIK